MPIHLKSRWNNIREGFWFLPSALILIGFTLGNILIALDKVSQSWTTRHLSNFFPGDSDAVKNALTTMAASIGAGITLIVSITIVSLTLASQQFGPRLLRNFLRDSTTKMILGTFFATGIFGFVVRFRMASDFIPYLSMSFAGLLMTLDVFLLILFVHHISTSIHVASVMARVSRDYSTAVERLFPPKLLETPPASKVPIDAKDIPPNFEAEAIPIPSDESGYIQDIDYEYLLDLARSKDIILQIHARAGEFIIEDTPLASVWPKASGKKNEIFKQVNDSIYLGIERTLTQDVEFAINQLVEIAVRALSAAVNDPFTAKRSLNRLAQGLVQLTRIQLPSPYLYDEEKKLRLIIKTITFPQMVNASFNLIRQNGINSPTVMITLLDSLASIAPFVRGEDERQILRLHAEMVERGCRSSLPEEFDRMRVRLAYETVLEKLGG